MEEKTEKPSQRKLKKAREQGEVVISSEMTSALILAGGVFLLWAFGNVFNERLKKVFIQIFSQLNQLSPGEALSQAVVLIFPPLALWMSLLFILAVVSYWVQTGWVWKRRQGRKKCQSRVIFTLFKVLVIGGIGFFFLKNMSPTSSALILKPWLLLVQIAIALVLIAFGDFMYQKWKYRHNMRMTKQELKEEQKEAEGNRQTKNKMRDRQK